MNRLRAAPLALIVSTLCGCAGAPVAGSRGPPQVATERDVLVGAALEMRGQPYRFGGDGAGGFDCSGLVFYAAGRAGLALPRTAAEQMRVGAPVERAGIEPGDLVFMRLSGKLHVGIATGATSFVHAPSTGGRIRIDSLAARPYAQAFLAARRVIAR